MGKHHEYELNAFRAKHNFLRIRLVCYGTFGRLFDDEGRQEKLRQD